MNKSRKNAIYFSKFNFPVFTVMDQVQPFRNNMSYKKLVYIILKLNYIFLFVVMGGILTP